MQEQKKVAMFLPFVLPRFGGTENATFSLAREMRSQSFCDVKVWAFSKDASFNRPRFEGEGNNSYLQQLTGVPVLSYPLIKIPKINDLSIRLILDLNRSHDDILHFQGINMLLSRFLIKKVVKNKITIITTHTLQESVKFVNQRKPHFIVYPFFFDSLRSLDHFIALSSLDANLLISMGFSKERITIIPNGVDERKFEKRRDFVNKNRKLKILCVAQFHRNKNFETVIQVVRDLSTRFDLEAYLIGGRADEAYLTEISQLVKNNKLEKIIKLGVSIDDSSLADCFLSCDLFLFLSRVETFPLVILEAMFTGLPIVTSNVGAIGDVVKNGVNGYLVEPDDVQQIRNCVSVLLEDSSLRKEIGGRNRDVAKSYTWSKVAIQTDSLYKKLVEEKKKN
jgi:glycosyltransferase involved in cell wall biosynthesis